MILLCSFLLQAYQLIYNYLYYFYCSFIDSSTYLSQLIDSSCSANASVPASVSSALVILIFIRQVHPQDYISDGNTSSRYLFVWDCHIHFEWCWLCSGSIRHHWMERALLMHLFVTYIDSSLFYYQQLHLLIERVFPH